MVRLAAAALLFVALLSGQQYADLSGLILDTSAGAVWGAQITVVNEDTGFRRTAFSSNDGGYVVASLQPGTYKMTVRKEGFRTLVRFGVKVDVSQPARVDFTLPVGDVAESITVEGIAPLLNSEDAAVATLVSRDRIERLPLNGRGLLSLLELAPGTVVTPATRGEAGQFTANGQRPNTHYFTVDGVSVNTGVSGGGVPAQCTGGSLPGMTAFGSLHGTVSLEALEEFRVQTSTSAPVFGRLPGAQVSLSSRSGSNEWRGSLFEYFRHERMAANDWFANRAGEPRAPLRVQHFGGTIGGRLRRDRVFLFGAYEGIRLRQPFSWRTAVPSLDFRRGVTSWVKPMLGLYPVPNGREVAPGLNEWTGRNQRPSRLDSVSLRLDASLTSAVTAFARYQQAPSASEFGSVQVNRLTLRPRSVTGGLDVRLKPGLVLDFRVNNAVAVADSFWQPFAVCDAGVSPAFSLCDRLVRFSIAGVGQVAAGHEGRREQAQWQALQTANITAGSHQVRVGIDYRRLAPSFRDASDALSIMAEDLESVADTRYLWIGISEASRGRAVSTEVSIFAQDTWRVAQRLTATYGVRWEISAAPEADLPAYFLDPLKDIVVTESRALWPAQYGNIAPRLGLAYRPGTAGRTVLRGGAGGFFSSSLSLATDMVNSGPLNVRQFSSGRYAPFSSLLTWGFVPRFRIPYVVQWSGSVEHGFTDTDVGSVTYTGSEGRRLLRREIGGVGNTETTRVALATNEGRSNYHALQLQYRRRFARDVQAVVSYSWSHSIDNSSSDSLLHWTGGGATALADRASSDFDVRHAMTAAFTFEVPSLDGWSLDGIIHARTGFPMDVLTAEGPMGLNLANAFRPDLVAGQPVWIRDGGAPGGARLNRQAFRPINGYMQGNLGRNAIAGFGMSQADVALRKEFVLDERRSVQVRLEAFNVFNQANLADPARYLANPLFGESPSMLNVMLGTGTPGSGLAPLLQVGGPRSVQISVRFGF
jgi:hypothetical protein